MKMTLKLLLPVPTMEMSAYAGESASKPAEVPKLKREVPPMTPIPVKTKP